MSLCGTGMVVSIMLLVYLGLLELLQVVPLKMVTMLHQVLFSLQGKQDMQGFKVVVPHVA